MKFKLIIFALTLFFVACNPSDSNVVAPDKGDKTTDAFMWKTEAFSDKKM